MAHLTGRLRHLAGSSVELLLVGETGVGKEVVAEAIHRESGRPGQFVAINCAALPEELIESELFGYARGAHSTAVLHKAGLIERAEGGTLYLDEIGEMSFSAQAKLLRFLQNGHYQALGTTQPKRLEVRLLAATHAAIAMASQDRGLRLDLATRFGPEPLVVPPLRQRPEDIGLLVQHFLGEQPPPLDTHAYRALFLNPWPGNVRELEKAVRMAGLLSTGLGSVGLDALPIGRAGRADNGRQREARTVAGPRPSPPELTALLERHGGNVGKIAREIGRQRTLVWRWLRAAGLVPARFRAAPAEVPAEPRPSRVRIPPST
jgi:transcriptional regulator with PAS, ATPase and Fis domain